MKWTDINDIAIELSDKHSDQDPKTIRFTDLYQWILELDGFKGDKSRCNERILEAVQQAWIDEQA
jgi:FeS assembly protein IscX